MDSSNDGNDDVICAVPVCSPCYAGAEGIDEQVLPVAGGEDMDSPRNQGLERGIDEAKVII